jgi:hypothetical protein
MNLFETIAEGLAEQARRRTGHTVKEVYSFATPRTPSGYRSNVRGEYRFEDCIVDYTIAIHEAGVAIAAGFDNFKDFLFSDPDLFDNIWYYIENEAQKLNVKNGTSKPSSWIMRCVPVKLSLGKKV